MYKILLVKYSGTFEKNQAYCYSRMLSFSITQLIDWISSKVVKNECQFKTFKRQSLHKFKAVHKVEIETDNLTGEKFVGRRADDKVGE